MQIELKVPDEIGVDLDRGRRTVRLQPGRYSIRSKDGSEEILVIEKPFDYPLSPELSDLLNYIDTNRVKI